MSGVSFRMTLPPNTKICGDQCVGKEVDEDAEQQGTQESLKELGEKIGAEGKASAIAKREHLAVYRKPGPTRAKRAKNVQAL